MPANLCIVVGCATKRARGYRDRRGKGGQLDVVCGTGLYRLGGTFLGLNQVRRVAGESDEDREVRLQVLRTKKVLDPGSVPLELVVSVLVTVVSFTLTCFSSHLIVTGTDPGRGDAVMPIMSVYRLPQGQYGYSGHVVNLPQDVASFVQSLPAFPLNCCQEGGGQPEPSDVSVHRAFQWLVTHNQYYHSLENNLYQPHTIYFCTIILFFC